MWKTFSNWSSSTFVCAKTSLRTKACIIAARSFSLWHRGKWLLGHKCDRGGDFQNENKNKQKKTKRLQPRLVKRHQSSRDLLKIFVKIFIQINKYSPLNTDKFISKLTQSIRDSFHITRINTQSWRRVAYNVPIPKTFPPKIELPLH